MEYTIAKYIRNKIFLILIESVQIAIKSAASIYLFNLRVFLYQNKQTSQQQKISCGLEIFKQTSSKAKKKENFQIYNNKFLRIV